MTDEQKHVCSLPEIHVAIAGDISDEEKAELFDQVAALVHKPDRVGWDPIVTSCGGAALTGEDSTDEACRQCGHRTPHSCGRGVCCTSGCDCDAPQIKPTKRPDSDN